MTATELDLTETIKLLHSISINPVIKGLNSNEYLSLKILISMTKSKQKNSIHVSDITKKMNIAAPSVTKLLNGLELKGYITRKNDSINRRNIDVFITEKGIDVKNQADVVLSDFIANVYKRVGRENIEQFLKLSKLISTAISDEIVALQNKEMIL